FKYNMTDIAAAIGLVQLAKCNQMLQARERIAAIYNEAFSELEEVTTPVVRSEVAHAWHLYPLRLNLKKIRITRAEFMTMMHEQNIGVSVHFIPLHLHPFYRDNYRYRPEDFPNASDAFERLVSLPIYPSMTSSDATDVVTAVRDIIRQHRR
ncbi:MAG TPA: DegT/DnrJ/EryC1/StrS family aminotransferase, partial [Candidatus Binataceae bacterium]|nr:DegT/DnrJ/EryC1/StrS family aminotransferase [Candidatus Binataceae bacterium]